MKSALLNRKQRALARLYRGERLHRPQGALPRVAIVGAGLAGMTAARLLKLAGLSPAVFDAAQIVGGRTRTERGGADGRQVWEMGGEFIDSQHDDIHAMAASLDIELLDTLPESEDGFEQAYWFGGQRYSPDQVLSAYAHIAPRIAEDVGLLSARPGHASRIVADSRFDKLSIAEYLAGLDMDAWLRKFIEVAYITVYGGDAAEQSALNLLTLIGTDTHDGLEIFGTSDERYKVRDGSDRLAAGLAQGLQDRIFLEHRLVRLRRKATAWRLSLQHGTSVRDVDADMVVLALPFTLLRQVDLGDLLPARQRLAVDQLGYGSNSKLMIGTRSRVWRHSGLDGGVYTDTDLQSSWDCSRMRGDGSGIFTAYLGGQRGLDLARGTVAEQAARHAPLIDPIFAGFSQSRTGEDRRVVWSDEPFALGSYTCYRPGQWQAFAGAEGRAVSGGLYFAGEHCATASQGYMNGAAETGRESALAILARLQAGGRN